jgi:hypothetical protein
MHTKKSHMNVIIKTVINFFLKPSVRKHMNRHLKNKRFKCDGNAYDKSFFILTEIKEHMISIHKKEKRFNYNYNSCDFKTRYN